MKGVRPLSRPLLSTLLALHEAGGAADLDVHCRLVVGHDRHPLPGDANSWLTLVAHGLVAGERGQIIMTEDGRDRALAAVAGQVRESAG